MLERILTLVTVVGFASLSIRLLVSGLFRRYRVFFSYAVFYTLYQSILGVLDQSSNTYEKIWVSIEPLGWLLSVLVVLEIYSLVLADYKGLSTAGRWSLMAAIVIAVVFSGISMMAPSQLTAQGHLLRTYYVTERAVNLSLVVFLLCILWFLLQYPITLTRNIIVHSFVFSVYFLANTVLFLVVSLHVFGRGFFAVVSYADDFITLAALAAWLILFNPAGETRKRQLRPQWMPGREEVLVTQLNQLNAALLRAARK